MRASFHSGQHEPSLLGAENFPPMFQRVSYGRFYFNRLFSRDYGSVRYLRFDGIGTWHPGMTYDE